MHIRLFFSCVLALLLGMGTASAQTKVVKLEGIDAELYVADNIEAAGRTVVLVPGGGYNHIAKAHEGEGWVPFFTQKGISVAIVRYRLPEGDGQRSLADVRTAFRQIHDQAAALGLNPNGVGIMGFSAGGHLASAYTNIEYRELKPAFCILFYPVIRLDIKQHLGMAKKFLGDTPSKAQLLAWSTNRMVTMDTPRTFLCTADDDPTIDPANALAYYEALRQRHVPATLKVYGDGGHGFGCRETFPYHDQMMQDLSIWLDHTAVPGPKAVKVACIGNSITYGSKLKFRNTESYPAQMQQMLGKDYWVKNYGVSGTTMTRSANPWTGREEWPLLRQWQPAIVFIKLGTNDVQPRYWKGTEQYTADYQALIDTLRQLPTHPRIVLCLPATSYREVNHLDADLVSNVIPAIRRQAKKNHLDIIDLHTLTAGHAADFPDKLHPSAAMDALIAGTLVDYLKQHQGH